MKPGKKNTKHFFKNVNYSYLAEEFDDSPADPRPEGKQVQKMRDRNEHRDFKNRRGVA